MWAGPGTPRIRTFCSTKHRNLSPNTKAATPWPYGTASCCPRSLCRQTKQTNSQKCLGSLTPEISRNGNLPQPYRCSILSISYSCRTCTRQMPRSQTTSRAKAARAHSAQEDSGTNREQWKRLRSLQLLTHRLVPNAPELPLHVHDLLYPSQLRRASHKKGSGIRDLAYN